MLREIVEQLYSNQDNEWYSLNPFLEKEFKGVALGDIRDAYQYLSKMIELKLKMTNI